MYFFFFKQKTAYEMRISDWSSDVCSSDLVLTEELLARRPSRIRCLCPLSSEANFAGKCMWLPPLRNTAGFLLPISDPRNLIFWTRSIARLGMAADEPT